MTKRFVTLALTMVVAVMAALNADAQTWNYSGSVAESDGYSTTDATNWEWNNNRWYYKTATNNTALFLGTKEFELTKGLKFKASANAIARNNNVIIVNGDIYLPSLTAGTKISVNVKPNANTNYLTAENITPQTNSASATSFENHNSTNQTTEYGTVTTDGVVTIKANNNCNIYSITIYDTDGTTPLTKAQVLPEEVSAPIIDYDSDNKTVTITPGQSSHENSVTTYYTIDGTAPTSASTSYSAPFVIDASCTVKAISISSETISSSVAERNVIVSEPNKVTLTLTADPVSGGTFTVNGEEYTSALQFNENTMQIVTATPANGYQFTKWQGTTNTKGDNYQVSLGTEDCKLTAEFKLTPTTVTPVTEQTLWTFDTFTDGTILSGTKTFEYNNLYINGNVNDESKQATINATGAPAIDGFNAVSKRIVLNGVLPSLSNITYNNSSVNTISNNRNKNSVAFKVGVPGTVYAYMNTTPSSGRKICIYSDLDGAKEVEVATATDAQVITKDVTAGASVYIGLSNGATAYIYAVKFVPTPEESITAPSFDYTEGSQTVTMNAGSSNVTGFTAKTYFYTGDETLSAANCTSIAKELTNDNKTYTLSEGTTTIQLITIGKTKYSEVVSREFSYTAPATPISNVIITGIANPVKSVALQSSTSGITTTDGTTVQSISWKKGEETVESGAVAEANTAYTVVLTLSANDNYEFASGVAATVNDQNATSVALADRTLTVTYQFAATDEDAPTAFGITNANTGNISVAGSATEGSDVTITVTVPNGKKIKEVKVYKTGEENTKVVTEDTDDATKFTFKMPAYEVTVAVEFEDVYSIVGQEVVSAEDATNWTFTSADEINAIKHLGEGLYGRGRDKSKSTNQQIDFSSYSSNGLKFNDGTSVSPSYYATTTGALSGTNKIYVSAGYDNGTLFTPSFAFNTTVAGTTYVKIKKPTTDATNYRFCIYFNNGTTITTGYDADASDNEINEIAYHNTEAGTVFIGSTGDKCEVYAIRYVPDTYEYTINLPEKTDQGSITGVAKAKAGDKVTLTVTPTGTYELEALSVKDANENEIAVEADHSFTMPASLVTVTATFREQTPKVELTITQPEEGGSIQIDGEAVSSKSVSKGDALTLTAVPASGYWLKQWLVGDVAQESKDFVLTITMDNAKTVTAEFEKLEVATGSVISFKGLKEENVTLSNSASFDITQNSDKYPQYTYKSGETGSLKINNIVFSYTSGTPYFMLHTENMRGSAKDGRIEIPNLKKDQIIVAEFSSNSSGDVSFALSNGTFITETTSVTGTTATKLKMKSSEDGSLIISNSTNGYRLYSIALANKLTTEVTKTDSNEEMGSIIVTPANTTDDQGDNLYLTGSTLTLKATPGTKYEFVNWTDENNQELGTDATSLTVAMNSNKTVKAMFREKVLATIPLTVTYSATEGSVTANEEALTTDVAKQYTEGDPITLKATAKDGYVFYNWTSGSSVVSTSAIYKITSIAAATTLTANFKAITVTVPVILTAGQSNTDGRAQNDSIPYYIKKQGTAYPNVYWSYGNATKDENGNYYRTVDGTFSKFWPACDAGDGRWGYDAVVYYHLQKTLNGGDLYVIKESKGNTAINTSCASSDNKWWSADEAWLSTATSADADGQSLLLALRDNIDKSLATLAANGKAADIKFLMWHQGEADRSKGSEYQTQLQQVIDYVRQYLVARTGNSAYSTLPVILGGIKSGTSQYKAEVESAKQTIANSDANIYYVSTDDIPVNGLRADNLHFNAKGAEMLGKKVYDLIATNKLLGEEYTYAEKEKSIFRPGISFDETTQKVTITPDTDSEVTGADSYYTLDGTTPTTSSNKYTAAFTITESCTVTANSIGSNGEESCTNKLEISLAPMPVVYDFANTTDNINAEDKTKSRNLWYNKDQTSTEGFRYVLNGSSKLRVLTYSSTGKFTPGTGLYLSGNDRAFAIEGLSNGDMVRVVHNGTLNDGNYTDKTGISITDNSGQTFTSAIASGKAIKISKSGDLADYAVFLTASKDLTISQLAINKGIKPQVSFKEVSGSSKIYTVQFYEGETLHYTAPGITGEQTVAYSSDNNGMKDITVSENGDLVCWTTFGGTEVANESTRNTITISVTSDEITVDLDENGSKATMTIENNEATLTGVTLSATATTITVSETVGTNNIPVTSIAADAFKSITGKTAIKAIDLSATSVTGIAVNRESGIFNGFGKETIIYLPSGTDNTAEGQKNVVIGGTCSDFEMGDGESYSIPASRSFTATSASFKRTFTADQKCTVCLPYPFTATGGTFYEFTGIVDNQVQMTAKTDGSPLSANTPYIFMPNPSSESITASNVIISMSDAPKTENTTFNFVGTYESKVWNEAPSGIYGFSAEAGYGATAGQFVRVGSGASIAPFRAYLEYTGDEAGKPSTTRTINNLPEVLDIVWIPASGGTTGINGLDHQAADGSPVYNLSGQRVDNSYKGIVIVNGKKMVKK